MKGHQFTNSVGQVLLMSFDTLTLRILPPPFLMDSQILREGTQWRSPIWALGLPNVWLWVSVFAPI